MARYKDEHKAEARAGIVQRAAERFRQDGIAAVGVRPLMADAGLTHGAFYAHFGSRGELVAEAAEYAANSTIAYLKAAVASAAPGHEMDALVKNYLRPRHREMMALGCAASALAPEIAREDDATRTRFANRNREIVQLVADCLPPGGDATERLARGYAIFAGMMGTLQLMRVATDPAEVAMLLAAGREAALALAARPFSPPAAPAG
ncbi:TetR/AcrR family transcriptional regulator [Sandaracinobacteroides hominis]|mgnify:CR=1 FL=1|uniref:TetR/AcrR family transcriptional regulator n=1 Tax=Sandaracinobacteroides hominis TaxID=2780086 RepID=UPI0018F320CB|nr:TetR/AcrR family transcriptional regulator [Sandaracinobacteroides hominis]